MDKLFHTSEEIFYDKNGALREEPEESLEELLKRYDDCCNAFTDFKRREREAAAGYVCTGWIGGIEPVFIEDSARNYAHRTRENAEWSDITLALAVDMSSPGEITTRNAAGDRYLGFELPKDLGRIVHYPVPVSGLADDIAGRIKAHPNFKAEGLRLNIAGNSQITLDRFGISAEDVRSLLRGVFSSLKQDGVIIAEVRSGGQTGVDEAGIKAAQDGHLRCSILAPKGFRMHYREGEELEGRELFTERFKEKRIDYEAWSEDDEGESFDWGLAGFNGSEGIEMLEYNIDLKIAYINAREGSKK